MPTSLSHTHSLTLSLSLSLSLCLSQTHTHTFLPPSTIIAEPCLQIGSSCATSALSCTANVLTFEYEDDKLEDGEQETAAREQGARTTNRHSIASSASARKPRSASARKPRVLAVFASSTRKPGVFASVAGPLSRVV